ncbi:MAG: SDR family oxidoreductase [Bacillota bacterium]
MKTALITGGAHGIGRATSLKFASEGYHVGVLDIDGDAGESVVRKVRATKGDGSFWLADVGEPEDVGRAVEGLIGLTGKIDALVSNAAIIHRGTLETLGLGEWEEQVRVNLTGSFLVTRTVGLHMMGRGEGAMVHVSSITGTHGGDNRIGYIATKGGVLAMSMSAAVDLAPYGVRVNAVAPGTVHTRLTRPALSDAARGPRILSGIPLGRAAEPEDIADVIYFLCSDESRYMTGSVVTVDGGITASP